MKSKWLETLGILMLIILVSIDDFEIWFAPFYIGWLMATLLVLGKVFGKEEKDEHKRIQIIK